MHEDYWLKVHCLSEGQLPNYEEYNPQIVPSDPSVLRLLSHMICDEPSEAHCSTVTLCLTQAMLCVS